MKSIAEQYARQIKKQYPNEQDRIQLCQMILTQVVTDPIKVQSPGIAESIACGASGLTWNKKTLHGPDAFDSENRGVELKTYKRVQNRRQINIMYSFPARSGKLESDTQFRERMYIYYCEDKKFQGGHYWVHFDQKKTKVRRWDFLDAKTVATAIYEYLGQNPKSKSKNFGGALCRVCKQCHSIRRLINPEFCCTSADKH